MDSDSDRPAGVAAAPSRFRFSFDGVHMALAGTVDRQAADELAGLLWESRIRNGGVRLNVSQLDFFDCRGLHTVVRWGSERIVAEGGTLSIEGASPLLRRVWTVLAFDQLPGMHMVETA
jgi:anti-anti-sigma regulatory factor